MAFKYKLTEDKHAGTKGMFRDLLDKWDAEGKEKEAEMSKLPQDIQDKIKNMAKEALSKKKCYECKTIKK
jgi:phosphoribosylaminoimidazole-succinocarboxamide synthase